MCEVLEDYCRILTLMITKMCILESHTYQNIKYIHRYLPLGRNQDAFIVLLGLVVRKVNNVHHPLHSDLFKLSKHVQ